VAEDKLERYEAAAAKAAQGGPSGAPSTAEFDRKIGELTRRIQDLEGEAKRAKLEAQESKRKLDSQALSKVERDDEITKLNTVLKTLSEQVVHLEHDIAVSEETCDSYEALIAQLRAELEKAKASGH
jgi:chromosome segregation ATPase